MIPGGQNTASVDEQVVATKLVRLLTASSRDLFLAYSDLRELRAEAIRRRAREAAKRLDVFAPEADHSDYRPGDLG